MTPFLSCLSTVIMVVGEPMATNGFQKEKFCNEPQPPARNGEIEAFAPVSAISRASLQSLHLSSALY